MKLQDNRWTKQTHARSYKGIMNIMLVRQRLENAHGMSDARLRLRSSRKSRQMPRLPLELWLEIMSLYLVTSRFVPTPKKCECSSCKEMKILTPAEEAAVEEANAAEARINDALENNYYSEEEEEEWPEGDGDEEEGRLAYSPS